MEQAIKPKRPAGLGFIFITLLIDVIGFGIIIPVFPKLIEKLTHGDIRTASVYGLWLTIAYATMQFGFSPVIGNLSDKFGRRPVLLASLLGFGIDYLFLAFAPTVWWLFVGRIIAGITGASFTTATAYIADISTDDNRAQNFGMVGAAFGMGFIIGPVLGGFLGHYGTQVPFLAASGLALLNALYGFFVLPESLAKDKRRPFEWKRANPVGSLIQLSKYPAVLGLTASYVLIYLGAQSVQNVWTYYTIEKFAWTERTIGLSLGMVGLLVGLVQGLLIRLVIPKLGKERSIVIGLILYSVGLFLFAIAGQGWMMFAFSIPYCLGGIAGPALQGIITSQVPPNEQGELQGGLTGLVSLTQIAGPLIMNSLFFYFSGKTQSIYFPGAPFLAGALFMLLSALFAVRNFKKEAKKQ
ncbi:DHA1 family tetracycline resistance protein-like MFS transporter [Mucilaginibacter gracilis]|uniref:DHA1 family tetracycline resistance protein-like MFS transporter n=1 Tax=Mucilaginibacter gracilis TaxID=423350 RepID=A0A495J2N5_9SPHI|nr:TCR/Tet family MFS transporter [Mucilaginibacter gracilis]RKR83093.1 DHA1 family tetracycline resistance protein-like MFS transporter [Mucilaginibacter gracilis]